MEASIPPFLVHLGLDTQADERAIRRAYAQRLKRVDQATEPQVFQALREAYETALRWCDWRRQTAEEAAADDLAQLPDEAAAEAPVGRMSEPVPEVPTPAAPMAEPTPSPAAAIQPSVDAPPSPQALADAVFAVFAARRDQVFSAEAQALEALELALADDRLVNLEARAMFEWQVACTLVEGWRPGHEFLFGPACAVFNWERERRALAVFGRVGATINAAIDERLMFFRLPPAEFDAYRQLVQRLRNDAVPDAAGLMRSVPVVRMLAQRYPHWLRLITSQANFTCWDKAFEAIPSSQHEAHRRWAGKQTASAPPAAQRPPAKEPFQKRESSFSPWWLLFAVLMVARLVSSLSDSSHSPSHPSSSRSAWQQPSPAAAPASANVFVPLFDVSPTAPVVTPPTAKAWSQAASPAPRGGAATDWPAVDLQKAVGEQRRAVPPPDLEERKKEAKDALARALAEPQGDAAPVAPAPAGVGLATPKRASASTPVSGETPGALGSGLPPETGQVPRLSYDLNRPADAASVPPSWQLVAPSRF